MSDSSPRGKVLLLSVGYGKGHHSAAEALAECYGRAGWETMLVDVCERAHPLWFRLTQRFYACCVRFLPWLWRVTYDQTDTADWSRLVKGPLLKHVLHCLLELLQSYKPDLVVCTYPLFAYMLDVLRERRLYRVPYAVVVTDAREISRPWMVSAAPLFIVPDSGSRRHVVNQYALAEERVVAAGFPVKACFRPAEAMPAPTPQNLSILYGAYRQTRGVEMDIRALLGAYPQMRLTVIAGHRVSVLKRVFAVEEKTGNLQILQDTDQMAELMRKSHFYIGKAGAATMFECYACHLPVLINYTLPGQEQGNLELLLDEGCGCHVESTGHLITTLQRLLEDEAREWCRIREAMARASRMSAAEKVAAAITNIL